MNAKKHLRRERRNRTIFITGTDTGVGKTVFASLLLNHYRVRGFKALAMKPFSSGSRADAKLLHSLQNGDCTLEEINPFHFSRPLAPYVAAQKEKKNISASQVMRAIRAMQKRSEILIVEGCGGLLVPLGRDFTIADLIKNLNCEVVVVAANRLGTINHTSLTVNHLRPLGISRLSIVLMNVKDPDESAETNCEALLELLGCSTFSIPFFDQNVSKTASLKNFYRKIEKTLAQNFA